MQGSASDLQQEQEAAFSLASLPGSLLPVSPYWSTFHLPVRGIVRNRWRTSLSLARNSSVVPVASGEAHIPLLSVCSAGTGIACSHTGAFLCSCSFLCLEAPSSLSSLRRQPPSLVQFKCCGLTSTRGCDLVPAFLSAAATAVAVFSCRVCQPLASMGDCDTAGSYHRSSDGPSWDDPQLIPADEGPRKPASLPQLRTTLPSVTAKYSKVSPRPSGLF